MARRKIREREQEHALIAHHASRRSWLQACGVAGATAALFAGINVYAYGEMTAPRTVAAVICGAVAGGGLVAHRKLRPVLGSITAVLVLAVAAAALLAGLAAASPQCPGSLAEVRCTGPQVFTWAVNGLALPITAAVLVGLPIRAARLARRAWPAAVRFARRIRGVAVPARSRKVASKAS